MNGMDSSISKNPTHLAKQKGSPKGPPYRV